MENYIGVKAIKAEPMTLGVYNVFKGWTIPENENPETEGYKVEYSDDYISWSPKEQFEKSHMKYGIGVEADRLVYNDIERFIAKVDITRVGRKTCVVTATLINGFEVVATSSCVDPLDYNAELSSTIGLEIIKDKLWELLGFLQQTAKNGFQYNQKENPKCSGGTCKL